jgi:hypothetical protein
MNIQITTIPEAMWQASAGSTITAPGRPTMRPRGFALLGDLNCSPSGSLLSLITSEKVDHLVSTALPAPELHDS